MNRIIVIGCPGSGKTTFSEKLHKLVGLPLYYLDAIWHKPDRTHITRDEFDQRLSEILSRDKWIIDGNYSRTVETRIQKSDTIFLFDLPTEVCLQGVEDRLGKIRSDMPWTDTEFDPALKKEIEQFPQNTLPGIYELLDRYRENKRHIIFHSRNEADAYLNQLMTR